MVRKAAVLAYRHITRDTEIEDELEAEIGRQPRPEAFDDDEAYMEALSTYTDALKETERYQTWYDRTIDPTLDISRQVGNWYTGSVHVARVSGLKSLAEAGEDAVGKRLLVGSYGSGAQAEIHVETVQENWLEEIEALNIDEQLEARYELTFEEYEDVHDAHNHDEESAVEEFTPPESEFVFDGWGRMGERKYRFVE
jgi:hydroxymethylglutaryl-CoA synthase